MKNHLTVVFIILLGLFLTVPTKSFTGEVRADDSTSREALKENVKEKKGESGNLNAKEKEERIKELQERKEERQQLGKQYKGAVASLTDEQKEVIRESLESLDTLTPREKAKIKWMLKKKQIALQNLSPEEKEDMMGKLTDFGRLSPLEKDKVLREFIKATPSEEEEKGDGLISQETPKVELSEKRESPFDTKTSRETPKEELGKQKGQSPF